jgi:hypothetical protein
MTATAIGLRLKPKPGIPQMLKVIAVAPDGKVKTLINR